MITENEILKKCNKTLSNVENLAATIGRSKSEIHIVAASKTMPLERIKFVNDNTSLNVFGENRVQELIDKYDPKLTWHFIGQLQKNKVKYIIDKVCLIHSLDRLSLAEEINKQAKKHNIIANVLIEINIAGEESKGGIKPDELFDFVNNLALFENLCVKGIMAVMPNVSTIELENYYNQLNILFTKLKNINLKNTDICYLSAGMSNDYEIALKYGANMIRLGRAIFGER